MHPNANISPNGRANISVNANILNVVSNPPNSWTVTDKNMLIKTPEVNIT